MPSASGERIERIALDEQGQGLVGEVPTARSPQLQGDPDGQDGGSRGVDARRQCVALSQPSEHRRGVALETLEDGLYLPRLGKATQEAVESAVVLPHGATRGTAG